MCKLPDSLQRRFVQLRSWFNVQKRLQPSRETLKDAISFLPQAVLGLCCWLSRITYRNNRVRSVGVNCQVFPRWQRAGIVRTGGSFLCYPPLAVPFRLSIGISSSNVSAILTHRDPSGVHLK